MVSIKTTEIFNELNTIDKTHEKFSDLCTNLAQAILDKHVTIHDVVENLGSLLVDSATDQRELGTTVLSEILEDLPNDFLTSTELHVISTFYADRLKDNHQLIPAVLRGILAIVRMNNLPEGAPQKILSGLFENVTCQQQQLKDRQNVYQIYKELLNHRTTEIKAMGLDFVLGVLQSMDGERDPRNLFLLFNWLPTFLHTVELGHLTEEMFDVMSCYFPIDFRTPSCDPDGVTRDSLANSLCPCLCALPSFAEFCIPLIIDKLNSSLKIAKYDSLNLLTESCKIFDVEIYKQHSHEIWDCLQKEILNSNDLDLEEASLNAVHAVINKLSQAEDEEFLKLTVNNLFDSLQGNLRPDTKMFIASSKILLATARASKKSCTIISQSTIALLLNHFNLTKDSSQQEIIFRTLMEFTVAYLKLFEITNIQEIKVLNEIPILCLQNIHHPVSEIRAISFDSLARIAKSLPTEIRQKLYEILKTEIVTPHSENIRETVLKCFKTFSNSYKTETLDFITSFDIDFSNLTTLKLYLEALSAIVSEKPFSEIILPQILNHALNNNLTVSKIAMSCLNTLLQTNCDNKYIQDYLYFECNIINRIIKWVTEFFKEIESDFEISKDISRILKNVIGIRSKDEQEIILKTNLDDILKNCNTNGNVQGHILIILEGFLVRLQPKVAIPDKYQLMYDLLSMSSKIDPKVYIYVCMLIANILNKSSDEEKFIYLLKDLESYIDNNVKNPDNEIHAKNLIQLICWIAKSLIVCGSNQSDLWTDKLIYLLDSFEEAGKCFKLIMDDSSGCLSKRSFCSNRLLYRQKFFAYVCKQLSSTYDENKPNHLIALGYLLQLAPQQVIILYFKEILRLLVLCLEQCKDSDVLSSVLNTLSTLISTKEPYLEDHVGDFLPRFLKLTQFEPSMKVRIEALKCLKELPGSYPVYKLLPHKQEVVFGLAPSLDDKKRLVRKQAVDARSRWFLLDAPT